MRSRCGRCGSTRIRSRSRRSSRTTSELSPMNVVMISHDARMLLYRAHVRGRAGQGEHVGRRCHLGVGTAKRKDLSVSIARISSRHDAMEEAGTHCAHAVRMRISEWLTAEIDVESIYTRKHLERVPIDKLDFQPHPKSARLGWLASFIAIMPTWGTMTLTLDSFDAAPSGENKRPDVIKT